MRRGFSIVAAIVALGSTAASQAAPFDWSRLHRPLRLPVVPPGLPCPILDASEQTATGQPLNGTRPVLLMSVGSSPAGVIPIQQDTTNPLGWRGQKTPWLVLRSYNGPVLIRATRSDGRTPVRFAKVYGQHLRELRFVTGENNGVQGTWRFLASTTLFRETGCYSFQIDGTTFTRIVTMRVVERTAP